MSFSSSVGWILRREDEQAKDGETDFVVCDPDSGYLCIEVKGGGIAFDGINGQWFSVDRNRQKHEINNPMQQALRAKYSVRPSWQKTLAPESWD